MCRGEDVKMYSVVAWQVFCELRRYADTPISGLGGYRCGADTPISGSGGISVRRRYADIRVCGDTGAAPIRRYPGLGGYRCGADMPISGSGGISVRRRYADIADIRVWGDIGAAPICQYPGLGRYRCGAEARRRYSDIRGGGYRRGADAPISRSGGYRRGADTPISGSGGILGCRLLLVEVIT